MGTRGQRRDGRRHGPARALAALVLALFALGWLGDRAHVAFESHSYCADHQQVEHADASIAHEHATGGDHAASHSAASHRSGPSIDALVGGLGAHEACCVLLARGGDPVAVPGAPASVLAFVPAVGAPIARARWTPARTSVPLLALAPKQSPPAT